MLSLLFALTGKMLSKSSLDGVDLPYSRTTMKGRPCSSFTTEAVAVLVSSWIKDVRSGITNPGTYQYLENIRSAKVHQAVEFWEGPTYS